MDYELALAKISKLLNSIHVPFMVIGGQAVLVYGNPRLTQDIDITLGISPTNSNQLPEAIVKENFQILVADPQKFLNETFVLPVMDLDFQLRFDFIFSLSEFEQEAIKRVNMITIADVQVPFISVEDLVLTKLIAARARDIEDVRGIILRNPDLNLDRVREWGLEYDRELETNVISSLELILKGIKV